MTPRLEVRSATFPLPRPARSTWAEVTLRDVRLVRLVYPDGVVGHGEASPLPGTSVESLAEVDEALRGLAGLGEHDPQVLAAAPASVRFAWSLAAADAQARRRGCPLAVAWGAREVATARPDLLAESVLEAGALVARCGESGRGLKIKLGPDDLGDLSVLRRVRAELDPSTPLTLDSNGRLTVPQARRVLEVLDGTAGAVLEEPVPTDALAVLAASLPAGIVLSLDESLRTLAPTQRHALVALGVRVYVLRPTTLGLDECFTLAAEARALGVAPRVAHAYEGPVGRLGLVALALALGDSAPGLGFVPPALPGLQLPASFDADPLQVLPAPGLGVEWVAA